MAVNMLPERNFCDNVDRCAYIFVIYFTQYLRKCWCRINTFIYIKKCNKSGFKILAFTLRYRKAGQSANYSFILIKWDIGSMLNATKRDSDDVNVLQINSY